MDLRRPLLGALVAVTLAAPAAYAQTAAPAPMPAPTPATPPPAAAPAAFTPVAPNGPLAQTLRASGQFTTLLKLYDMAGLSALLTRQLTMFAPTDAAFAAMPPGELSALMQPNATEQLRTRLLYMLFNGSLDYSQLEGKNGPVPGVGGPIYVNAANEAAVKVNDANLLQADVKASNGDIYVIDKVIAPGYTPPPAPAEEPAPAQ